MLEEIVEGRDGLHQTAEETGCGALAIGSALTAVPDSNLVDADALDGLDLCLDEFGQFLEEE